MKMNDSQTVCAIQLIAHAAKIRLMLSAHTGVSLAISVRRKRVFYHTYHLYYGRYNSNFYTESAGKVPEKLDNLMTYLCLLHISVV